jgi:acetolactate synthase-1/2/3 large subunit
VASQVLGSDAFQETDVTGITLPITKHNALVTDVRALARTLREAFAIARSGRPGPVLVDICKDAQQAKTAFEWPESVDIGEQPVPTSPREEDIARVLELVAQAERPLILAGQGVLISGASDLLRAFVDKTSIPVAQTLLGLGGFPASHPLCLGMMGMHGQAHANTAIQSADLLLAFGMRFDDRVTGKLATYAPKARKVHVEIDVSEVGKNVPVDVAIVADLRPTLEALLPEAPANTRDPWKREVASWRDEARERDVLHQPDGGKLLAAHVVHDLWKATGGEALVVSDVGQHQMWEAQYYRHERPATLITSGGLGTMGFALPAAIGAKLARPEAEVWVVAGDGGFQMTQAELATLRQERLDIKIAVINNGFLGMVRQLQDVYHDRHYSQVAMMAPDFVALAGAYGIEAHRVKSRSDVVSTIESVRGTGRPALIEFQVHKLDSVYPMVTAGSDLHEMVRRPAPVSDQEKAS